MNHRSLHYNKWTLLFDDKHTRNGFSKEVIKDELYSFISLIIIVTCLQLFMILVDLSRVTFANDIVIYRALDLVLFICSAAFLSLYKFKSNTLYQSFFFVVYIIHVTTLIMIDYNTQIPSFFLVNAFITTLYLTVVVGVLRFLSSTLFIILMTMLYYLYASLYSPHSDILLSQMINLALNLVGAITVGYLTERMKVLSHISKLNLRLKAEETKQLIKTKDELLNLIAVDLKTPVVELEKTFNRLKNEEGISDTVKPQLSQVSNRFANVSNLLINLGQWSASQLNRIEVTKETFNINEAIYDVKPLFDEIIVENNITLILPEKGKTHFITADIEMTKTVIRNLLANAFKFASHYGVVRVSTTSNESFTTFSVNNDGPGIPEDKIDQIFSVDSETVKDALNRGRSGLSLVVCKSFVELNDGKIWVNSVEGDGTTFHVQYKTAF